jgi:hypothetical protein
MDHKSQHELAVFAEFAKAASLRFSATESRQPPEPDILAIDENGPVYFELGRLLDPEMQRMKLHAMRRAPEQVALADYNVKLPEREMLMRKIEKQYQLGSLPIELLLYYDNSNWLVGDVPVAANFVRHADFVMRPICEQSKKFRREWVFERHHNTVLWCYLTPSA